MQFNFVVTIGGFVIAASAAVISTLSAQTTFTPAGRDVDVAEYRWVEQCIAASERVADSVRAWDLVSDDTLIWDGPKKIREAVSLARVCGEKFPAATASLEDFRALLKLYQKADMPEAVVILLQRQLATISDTAILERFRMLGVAAANVLVSGPAWFSLADSLHTARMQLARHTTIVNSHRDSAFIYTIGFYNAMRESAKDYRDSAWVRRAAQELVECVTNADTSALQLSYYGQYGQYYMFEALIDLQGGEAFDSLRRSSEGYIALRRSSWAGAAKNKNGSLEFPLGMTVPPLDGAFWFGRGDTTEARPMRGRPGLIVFVDDFLDRNGWFSPQAWCTRTCLDAVATTRRLARRFPSLQVTLVARTRGFFRGAAPPTPREEAEWLNRYFLAYQKLPAALVVEHTEFWRLDAPDLRRVDEITPNFARYGELGRNFPIKQFTAILVDEAGVILEMTRRVKMFGGLTATAIDRKWEDQFAALIGILVERERATTISETK